MVKHRALIRRLDAIETLGSITVICADKTGTMTMNQMHVEQVLVFTDGDEKLAARIGASCNRAELPDIGDPTEVALLVHAEETNAPRLRIEAEDVPFTSEAKYMVTSHTVDGKTVKYWKGAPEVIAGFCDESQKKRIHIESQRVSEQGLRVLAVAEGNEGSLRCVGLIALLDPPRPTVREAIARALTAGIRTIMITGDHPATALAIATRIGIRTDGVIDGITLDTMSDHILNDALYKMCVKDVSLERNLLWIKNGR
jgi:Ca2+-transporting ATPase